MFALPDKSLRSVLAGIESAVLSWAAVALIALVGYAATAAAPGLGDADWTTALATGTGLWTVGFGGVLPVDDGAISLIPLAIPWITFLLLRGTTKRHQLTLVSQAMIAAGTFVLVASVLSLANGVPAGRHIAGFAVVGLLATHWQIIRDQATAHIPMHLQRGLSAAWWTFLTLIILGMLTVGIALIFGWSNVVQMIDAMRADVVSIIVMVLLQAAYLPTVAAWAVSYLAGPGFIVGTGTHFAADAVHTEPLPSIPILGALPASTFTPGIWVCLLPIVVGVVVAFWFDRKHRLTSWRQLGTRSGVFGIALWVFVSLWMALSTGSIGPGRMAEMGVSAALLSGFIVALEITAGYAAAGAVLFALSLRKLAKIDQDQVATAESAPTQSASAESAQAESAPAQSAAAPTASEPGEDPIDEAENTTEPLDVSALPASSVPVAETAEISYEDFEALEDLDNQPTAASPPDTLRD